MGVVLGIAAWGLLCGPAVAGGGEKTPPRGGKAAEKRIAFQMQATPWKKVFEWLADQTGLPMVVDHVPTGTFTFIPPTGKKQRTFTVPEVIDVVNEALQVKRYVLIRRPASLQLVPADEKLDAALAPLVRPDELSQRGKTEIVRTILPLDGVEAKEALAAVKSLLGPFGEAIPLGNRLLLRDTVGNLRQIVRLLQEVGTPAAPAAVTFAYPCKFIKAAEARKILEELVGTPPARAKGNGRFSMSIDERTNTLHIRGSANQVDQAKAILTRIDIAGKDRQPLMGDAPILKVYPVPSGYAEVLAGILQSTSGGWHRVRVKALGASRILVYATPEEQFAIARNVLIDLQPTIEVLPLTTLEAARTVEVLRTLFSAATGGRPGGLSLEADSSRNAVIVRGLKEQVDEVKVALRALGEVPAGRVRIITLESGDAAVLAEALQGMLQKLRPNPVRVIVPGGKTEPAPKTPARGKDGAEAKKAPGKGLPPVTLTVAGNKLVAACDDPQVLALVQELARLVAGPQQGGLEVIRLHHSKAVEAARVLDEAFNGRRGPGTNRVERVRIVADPSNNTLVVRASTLDLLAIRRLLSKSLDSRSRDEDGGPRTYFLGPLRHARAADLVKVLRELYHEAGKPAVTIAAEPRTNSLILRGSVAVYQDARKLVEQLDVKVDKKE